MGTLQGKRGNLVNEYQQSDMHRSNSGTKSAGYRRIASRCISTGVILSCLLAFHAIAEASTAPAKGKRPVSANAASSAHPVIVSEFSDVDFVPDGDLGKKVWATARRVRFDQGGFTRIEYPKAETVVASRWTAKYLYLAFWCHYQELNTYHGEDPAPERWGLWDKDVVETFISPQPGRLSHYYEFELAPTNQWVDLEIDLQRKPFNDVKWNSGFEHAIRIDPVHHVWTAEMRIPVQSMKVDQIRPNAEWRLNFYRNDGAGVGQERRKLSWGPLPRKVNYLFHQPASFGTIRFER